MRWALVACVAMSVLGDPGTARAYLLDANDATTAEKVELELQPVGWYQTFGDEGERYLIAPSFMLYVGLTEGWDVILLGRGYVGLDPGLTNYSVSETVLLTRIMLRDGNYHGDEDGPSVALQVGFLLPQYQDTGGAGASAALLISQAWEGATLHFNVQADRRRSGRPGVFATLALEGPTEWPVHGFVEGYADYEDGSRELSILGGINAAPSESWNLGAGVRYFDIDGEQGMEVRFSLYAAL